MWTNILHDLDKKKQKRKAVNKNLKQILIGEEYEKI